MKPNVKQFKVKQLRELSKVQTVCFILFALLFLASIGMGYGMFALPIFAVGAFIYKSNWAHCILRADHKQLSIEVVKSGWGIPASYTEMHWKELVSFNSPRFSKTRSTILTVKWLDGTRSHFSDGEHQDLYDYLCKYFPDKKQP